MNKYLIAGAVFMVIVGVFSIMTQVFTAQASAPAGLPATVATSSNPSVGTTAVTLAATSTGCAARIVTSRNSPLMLTFSDFKGDTPTATAGHLQLASTTIAYDSGIYGCGAVKAFGYVADTITVTETR